MTWIWIIAILGGLIALAQVLSVIATRGANRIMKRLEQQYEEVVSVLVANAYLKDDKLENREELVHTCMQTLKPLIDSLLAYINSTDLSDVKISANTRYFDNVASFAGELFQKRNKHKAQPVSREDENKMYAIFREAIEADIIKRQLYLQVGR